MYLQILCQNQVSKNIKKEKIKTDIILDIVLNEELCWIVFHGGFDFAYLT